MMMIMMMIGRKNKASKRSRIAEQSTGEQEAKPC